MSKHSLVYPSHALSRKPSLHTAHTEFTKSSKGPKLSMLIFKKQSPLTKNESYTGGTDKGCRVSIRPVCSSLVRFLLRRFQKLQTS